MGNLDNLISKTVKSVLNETLEKRVHSISKKIRRGMTEMDEYIPSQEEIDDMMSQPVSMDEEVEVCSECGNEMREGECSECGYKMEGIYDETSDFPSHQSFDYVEEMDISDLKKGNKYKYNKPISDDDDNDEVEYDDKSDNDDTPMYKFRSKKGENILLNKSGVKRFINKKDIEEELYGKQKNLDVAPPKGKLTSADFKKLRSKKETDESMDEGNAFSGALAKAKETGKSEFEVDGKKYQVKESKKNVKDTFQLTETEMIDMIEKIILEQKNDYKGNLKAYAKPRGMSEYEKAVKGSKKENDEYIKSVTKKMKEYLKTGSLGEYEMEPNHFPKNNGELGEMKKKAYKPSDSVKDYIDNFTAAGQENLVYDEINPNEEWLDKTIEGSSVTGNNPKWANAVETPVNKKRNQIRKDNLLGAVKRQAYNKSEQPVVNDTAGEYTNKSKTGKAASSAKANKIFTKLESVEPVEDKVIKEEKERMMNLISYKQKTQ
jgi:hypothetical protein